MKIAFIDSETPNSWLSLTCLWLILWACATTFRPLLPIDETRCVSVAWEMWQNGNLLVPHLNGIPYSHKPPLLFWLILAGWKLFGVNEWWPRLLPPLFALWCLFLTSLFALRLWPDQRDIAFSAPHILLGSILWTLWTTVVMYDMLIVFFVLLSLLCLHSLASGKNVFWLPAGLSLGLGILSKGPVILLPFILVAPLAPWWRQKEINGGWLKYSAGIFLAVTLAAVISLSWALPAAQSGGPEYAGAILWGQTTKRMIGDFAHQHPLWWYFPWIPAILFPWTVNPLFWRNIRKLDLSDSGIRFCLSWLLPPLIAYSMISGKQVYYLLPLFPAFALLSARALTNSSIRPSDLWPGVLSLFFVGLLMAIAPFLNLKTSFPAWVRQVSPIFGILSIFAGLFPLFLSVRKTKTFIWSITLSIVLIIGIIHIGIFSQARPYYDLHDIASILKKMENKGYSIAHEDTYYGQFHFPGRLEKPFEVIKRGDALKWLETHPQGRVVVYFKKWPSPVAAELAVEYVRPYMGKYFVMLTHASSDRPISTGNVPN
jgi:4-amino-4-deoxy-L-arabinose transferase-like glycosyltransferase